MIEPLELRIAPATIVVTNLSDEDGAAVDVSLREAIELANSTPAADTIKFAPELAGTLVLTGGELVITQQLSIFGGGRVTISGNEASRIFNVTGTEEAKNEPLTLNGLRFIAGKVSGPSDTGAMIRSGEGLTIIDCLFADVDPTDRGTANDEAALRGGGVYVDTQVGGVTILRSHFTDLDAVGDGGGLYVRAAKPITIIDSVFADNAVGGDGGGAYLEATSLAAKLTITGSIFSGNEADGPSSDGGGLCVVGFVDGTKTSKVAISRSQFADNTASEGGGLHLTQADLTLSALNVAENQASRGGGMFVGFGTSRLAVTKGAFVGNTAGGSGGGGVLLSPAGPGFSATFIGCQFADNLVASSSVVDAFGAGLYANSLGEKLTVSGSLFADNRIVHNDPEHSGRGGGLASTGSAAGTLVLMGNTFTANEAESGGGIYATGNGAIVLTKNRILGNVETVGALAGGAYLSAPESVTLIGNSIVGNRSANGAGGLGLGGGSDTVFKSNGDLIAHNQGESGGVVTHASIAGTIAKTTRIFGNVADSASFAGGLSTQGADVTLLAVVTGNYNRNVAGEDQISGDLANTPPVAPAIAGNITVTTLADTGAGSLRAAIEAANATPGVDKIRFDPALAGTITLASGAIEITEPLTINGGGKITLAGGANPTGILRAADSALTVSGLTFIGGKASVQGGAIYTTETLTVLGCIFLDNFAPLEGGALFAFGSRSVTIKDSLFAENGLLLDATPSHAGAVMTSARKITVSGSTFSGNIAGRGGGAYLGISSAFGSLSLSNTLFADNTANDVVSPAQEGKGGGLIIAGVGNTSRVPKAVLNAVTFARNHAEESGGGLVLETVAPTITNSVFADNTAADGGGLHSSFHVRALTVTKSVFVGNAANDAASGGGGALIERGGGENFTARFSGTKFLANSAFGGGTGGGLLADGLGGKLVVSASLFVGNYATTGGGLTTRGADLDSTAVSLSGNTFVAGRVINGGGGVSLIGDGPLILTKNLLLANETSNGAGGGVLSSIAKIALSGNSIIGNRSVNGMGGLLISGPDTASLSLAGDRILFNEGGTTGGLEIEGAIAAVIAKSVKISGNVGVSASAAGGLTQESTNNVHLLATVLGNLHRTDPAKNETFGQFAP